MGKHHDVDPDFSMLARHCESASPITSSEFYQRQKTVAGILHSLNASAYIAEPGANAQYFGNVSSNQWSLSERPLLFVVSPHVVNDEVEAKITILTPSFEASRARLLPIPSVKEVVFAEWAEESNPYDTVVSTLPPSPEGEIGTIFVDGAIRHFIVDGLDEAAPKANILSAPMEIRQLRERKSAAEIELMKCVNEVSQSQTIVIASEAYVLSCR
jgi:Xaa-Pro aminopeptidase